MNQHSAICWLPLLAVAASLSVLGCRPPLAASPPAIDAAGNDVAGANTLASPAGSNDRIEHGVADETFVARETNVSNETTGPKENSQWKTATFGAGCFWCVEAVFEQLEGVKSVVSGYSGGFVDNPTYQAVCSGGTGHAEVCQIQYDPQKISFDELLEVFWQTHDPTTLNRQGADVGTQYRSVIFYHDDQQREMAQQRMKQLDQSGAWDDPIVTEIAPLKKFYVAEKYHQNYYRDNPQQGYCQFVVRPKVEKLKKVFKDKLKQEPAP